MALVAGDPLRPGAWWPLAGCVHQPATGATWTAGRGLGARLGERELRLPPPPDLAQALVATGFGYRVQRRVGQARVLTGVLPKVRDIRRIGSAALDLCAVADGRLDCYYERGLNPWDLAAAWLVVTEAGGIVTGLSGGPPDSAMVLAAPPGLHPQLEALVRGAVTEVDADGTTVQAAE